MEFFPEACHKYPQLKIVMLLSFLCDGCKVRWSMLVMTFAIMSNTQNLLVFIGKYYLFIFPSLLQNVLCAILPRWYKDDVTDADLKLSAMSVFPGNHKAFLCWVPAIALTTTALLKITLFLDCVETYNNEFPLLDVHLWNQSYYNDLQCLYFYLGWVNGSVPNESMFSLDVLCQKMRI